MSCPLWNDNNNYRCIKEHFLSYINQPHVNLLCAVMKLLLNASKSLQQKEKRSDLHIMTHRVAKWKHSFQYEYIYLSHISSEEKKISRYWWLREMKYKKDPGIFCVFFSKCHFIDDDPFLLLTLWLTQWHDSKIIYLHRRHKIESISPINTFSESSARIFRGDIKY